MRELDSKEVITHAFFASYFPFVDHIVHTHVLNNILVRTQITDFNMIKASVSRVDASENPMIVDFKIDKDIFKTIYDILYVILSDNEIYPGIGFSDRRINIPTFNVPSWDVLDLAIDANGRAQFNEHRVALHQFLFRRCVELITYHEITHIYAGHISYRFSLGGEIFDEGQLNNFSILDAQTLEMHADSNALFLMYIGKQRFIPSSLEFAQQWLISDEEVLKMLVFCALIISKCIPFDPINQIARINVANHPPQSMRFFFMASSVTEYLKHEWSLKRVMSVIQEGELLFSKVAARNLLPKDYQEEILFALSPEGIEHSRKILTNWKTLKLSLEPFSKFPL